MADSFFLSSRLAFVLAKRPRRREIIILRNAERFARFPEISADESGGRVSIASRGGRQRKNFLRFTVNRRSLRLEDFFDENIPTVLLSVLVHGYDNVGFDGWYQPVPHRPVDIITDVINDLGVRILQQYTAHGNVAFSPTGVGFVLAALYEGSAGRGRQQIADALGLPRDRDITRIGFRDIHRRLRVRLA